MAIEAHAFWVREPGVGEIRPVALARPAAATRCSSARVRSGRQPRHRGAGLRRPRAGEPARRDAGAVPGGRLPGTGEVRLPQRRRRRGGPGRPARPHGVLPAPAPDALRGPGRGGARRARTTSRPSARCSPAPSRRRSTPCGTPGRWSATASPSSAPDGRLLRGAPARTDPGGRVTLVDVDPSRADVADGARGASSPCPADARGRPGPGRAHQRHLGRAAALARPAGAGGRRCST